MIPRLTKLGRKGGAVPIDGSFVFASRPSPAERLRQRRKARAEAHRWAVVMMSTLPMKAHV